MEMAVRTERTEKQPIQRWPLSGQTIVLKSRAIAAQPVENTDILAAAAAVVLYSDAGQDLARTTHNVTPVMAAVVAAVAKAVRQAVPEVQHSASF